MAEASEASEAPAFMPDGRGLDALTLELVADGRLTVHLRLTRLDGVSARVACDGGLGQLWSGRADEVTCPVCLEVVHA